MSGVRQQQQGKTAATAAMITHVHKGSTTTAAMFTHVHKGSTTTAAAMYVHGGGKTQPWRR